MDVPDDAPGPRIGAGRDADVYAFGEGKVLRRYRRGGDVEAEAQLMRYLLAAGFPVPEVFSAEGQDLVMERLDGPDMLADAAKRPWLLWRHARTLASLHDRLHAIDAPPGMRGAGGCVLHWDLHPANVMMTARGPVVIDWRGARSGLAGVDVAMTHVIMASSDVDLVPMAQRPVVLAMRNAFLRCFLAAVHDDARPHLATAVRERLADPSVRPAEALRLQRLVPEEAPQPAR